MLMNSGERATSASPSKAKSTSGSCRPTTRTASISIKARSAAPARTASVARIGTLYCLVSPSTREATFTLSPIAE